RRVPRWPSSSAPAVPRSPRSAACGVLRLDPGQPSSDMPPAGLDGLPELVDRVRSTGLHVDLDMNLAAGDGSQLPAALAVSVYRIVQEALTNVVAHTAATHC